MRVEEIAGRRVLFFAEEGRLLASTGDTNDFISDVWPQNADMTAIPLSRLGPDFLKLSTRLAGEAIQKFVNYGIPLAILGDVTQPVAQSGALRDFIYESNKGKAVWFLRDADALRGRLTGTAP